MVAAVRDPIEAFLADGFDLRAQLAGFLGLSAAELEQRLPHSTAALAAAHPGALAPEQAEAFYESAVGDGHLYELAAWHLGSADYIADTIKLQAEIAHGQHLDFGGGIGSHALAAAQLPQVEHVWVVELNGRNRAFVEHRAQQLGVAQKLSCLRDLDSPQLPSCFDSLTCLDVLEHLADPAAQLRLFAQRLEHSAGVALLNWYFFKGFNNEYPFHFDDPAMVEGFFRTLQDLYLERFHPHLITARTYTLR
ncbi:MAG: methyltransferase domain-containing protein [Synechococcus sp.]|nr:methyltransferase domain-containing protein [Synechococcus sp.]